MPEILEKGGQEQLEQGSGPEQVVSSEVPEYNPERAQALRDEYARENAENDKSGEMPVADGEFEAEGVELESDDGAEGVELEESDSEVGGIETADDRLKLNRDKYNSLVRRKLFLKSQYPDLSEAPKSIQDEYAASSAMMTYLDNGVTATTHGAELKRGEDGGAVAIDAFHRDKYEDAKDRIATAREENANLLDAEAEAAFEVPKVDVADFEKRLNEATNAEEVMQISKEATEAGQSADMDTMYALRRLDFNSPLKGFAERQERDQAALKTERLESALAESQKALATAQEDYKKAGLFKKIGLKLSGKANFKALKASVEASNSAVEAWHNDAEYKRFF